MIKPEAMNSHFREALLETVPCSVFIVDANDQTFGLMPAGIDHQKINYVGNTSLAGAKLALLSANARQQAEELARKIEHLVVSVRYRET